MESKKEKITLKIGAISVSVAVDEKNKIFLETALNKIKKIYEKYPTLQPSQRILLAAVYTLAEVEKELAEFKSIMENYKNILNKNLGEKKNEKI